MIKPEIIENVLHLEVEGADKIWSLKSRLSIPIKHITDIRIDSDIVRIGWHGLKMPGSNIPGVITAGTFYVKDKRVFWDIHNPKEAVVISLLDESYNELVIEVEDPKTLVKEVLSKIKI